MLFVDNQRVDETARHADIARVERTGWNDLANDGDRSSPGRFGGLGQGAVVPQSGLVPHGQVSVLVGFPGVDQGDVHRNGLVEQPRFARDLGMLDQRFGGLGVQPAAFEPWIHECVQARVRVPAGAARCGAMKQLHHHPRRQAVGGETVLGGELCHRWCHRPVTADHAPVQAGQCHLLQALVLLVSHPKRV